MSDSSIIGLFDFISYKIEKINLVMNPQAGFLLNNSYIKPENAELSIMLRNTEKFIIDGRIIYIGGLSTKIVLTDEKTHNQIMNGEFGISGAFTPVGTVDETAEQNFTKINLPALLMPYMRAAMTNTLASAGFGTVLFPLVNIYELARNTQTQLVDHTIPPSPGEKI
ncbi:hypothetical protein AGMMS49944_20760 [Spirochaetia bacterium]|nr:hypothetical protein AGMMS49944_20760 [Spirochaetia bacterium]